MSSELEDAVAEVLDREYIWEEGAEYNAFFSSKTGWPDFIIHDYRNNFTFCIEVKSPTDKVRRAQQAVHELLRHAGIPVLAIRVSKNWDYGILRQDILREVSLLRRTFTGYLGDRHGLDIGWLDDIHKELMGVSKKSQKSRAKNRLYSKKKTASRKQHAK